jgi:nitronate monooxygenase
LILQGLEAGGHRGTWVDGDVEALALRELLSRVSSSDVDLPLVATGGIADADGVAEVLAAGAVAAQVGTAFMLAPEAGTHPAHREAISSDRPTALTRAFTGRLARGIENRFMAEHYPHINYATAPLRAAARARGDADGFNLWAGQAHSLAVARPAAETVRVLSAAARAA